MSPSVPAPPPIPGQVGLESAVRRLQGGRTGRTPERKELVHIAVLAAADVRDAVAAYRPTGFKAARAEADYRKLQAQAGHVITFMKAEGLEVTPEGTPFPAGVEVGDLKTAGERGIVIDALCAEARYARDCAAVEFKGADRAMRAMEQIVSLMQTLIRSDDTADKIQTSMDGYLAED